MFYFKEQQLRGQISYSISNPRNISEPIYKVLILMLNLYRSEEKVKDSSLSIQPQTKISIQKEKNFYRPLPARSPLCCKINYYLNASVISMRNLMLYWRACLKD